MNQALASTSGRPVAQLLGRTVAENVPAPWPELQPLYARVLKTGEPVVNSETSAETRGDLGRPTHG